MGEILEDLKEETLTLTVAYTDSRTPIYAKAWMLLVVAYAVSPIDLIPDFIPVIGYVDDAIILPLGIAVAIKMIPEEVHEESKKKSGEIDQKYPYLGTAVVILVWSLLLILVLNLLQII